MANQKDLDALLKQGQEALSRLRAIEILGEDNRRDIIKLTKFMFGNGQRGLIVKVEDLERFKTAYEKEQEEKRKDNKQMKWLIIGTLLALLLNFAYNIFGKGVEESIYAKQKKQIEKMEQLINELEKR